MQDQSEIFMQAVINMLLLFYFLKFI